MAGCPRSASVTRLSDFQCPRKVEANRLYGMGDVLMLGTSLDEDQEHDVVMRDTLSEKCSSSDGSEITTKLNNKTYSEITPLQYDHNPLPRVQARIHQPSCKLSPGVSPFTQISASQTEQDAIHRVSQTFQGGIAAGNANPSHPPTSSHHTNAPLQGFQLQRISTSSMPTSTLGRHPNVDSSLISGVSHGDSLQSSSLFMPGENGTIGYLPNQHFKPSNPRNPRDPRNLESSQQNNYWIPRLPARAGRDLQRLSSSQGHPSITRNISLSKDNRLKRISSLQSNLSPTFSNSYIPSFSGPQRISSVRDVRSELPSYLPWQLPEGRVKSKQEEIGNNSLQTQSQQMNRRPFSSGLSRVQSGDPRLSDQYQGYNFNAAMDSSDPFSLNGSSITTRSTLLSFPGDRNSLRRGLDGIQGFDDSEDSMIF